MCSEREDQYGNPLQDDGTCDELIYCVFPNCGCDGARLCMAKNGASANANCANIEGMWSMKTKEQREAVGLLTAAVVIEENIKRRSR
jgi:hypothetical protein